MFPLTNEAHRDPSEPLPALSGVRVLVVDDEPDTRELLRVVLEEHQARVTVATSAAEAFELLVRAPPHMLVSDIDLPDEEGHALIRRVRSLHPEQGGQVPAAALTAFSCPEDRTRALLAGFQVHVPKPIDTAELVRTIAHLVNCFAPRRAQGVPAAAGRRPALLSPALQRPRVV
jgi:CheY-like chemotaxis protein